MYFFVKKQIKLFFSLLKMKKSLCHMSLFLFLSGIVLGWYGLVKSEGFGKKDKGLLIQNHFVVLWLGQSKSKRDY